MKKLLKPSGTRSSIPGMSKRTRLMRITRMERILERRGEGQSWCSMLNVPRASHIGIVISNVVHLVIHLQFITGLAYLGGY